ncbi:MAG: RNA-binding S4 domain-containing protein [Gammaproteobacteria bacterium]
MDDQRLDKWLWCARFYKTRTLAQDAIKAGHVSVDGQRPKPSKLLIPGQRVSIRRPPFEIHVDVLGIAKQRLSAPLAQALYQESDASRVARERLAEQLKLSAVHEDIGPGKLDRRDRRERATLKRRSDSSLTSSGEA